MSHKFYPSTGQLRQLPMTRNLRRRLQRTPQVQIPRLAMTILHPGGRGTDTNTQGGTAARTKSTTAATAAAAAATAHTAARPRGRVIGVLVMHMPIETGSTRTRMATAAPGSKVTLPVMTVTVMWHAEDAATAGTDITGTDRAPAVADRDIMGTGGVMITDHQGGGGTAADAVRARCRARQASPTCWAPHQRRCWDDPWTLRRLSQTPTASTMRVLVTAATVRATGAAQTLPLLRQAPRQQHTGGVLATGGLRVSGPSRRSAVLQPRVRIDTPAWT